ncbi:hypothetical protein OPQ81_007329 [Rhizoctonia solani]|nr:hypothetical protein OPQ81_007329 [Rhizoctonia solani]
MYNPIYPSVVLKIFKDGCQKPFSLFLLTDKYVLSPEASKPVGEKLLIGQGNTLYTQATDPSPLVGGLPETELTYSQYMQAMPRFIELHREFHGDDLAQAWQGHFRNVKGFRPQNWHQNIYDRIKKRFEEELFDGRIKKLDSAIAAAQSVSHSITTNASKSNASQVQTANASSSKAGQHSFRANPPASPDNGIKTSRCFNCGRISHIARDCNCTTLANGNPTIIDRTSDGKNWTLDGKPFCYNFNNPRGCSHYGCSHQHVCSLCRSLDHVAPNLIPDTWESMLRRVGLLDTFGDIPIGLREGLHIGAAGPVTKTIIYDNHKSARDRPNVIRKHINDELLAGRYFGPFTCLELEDAISPFKTAPLGTVDKPSAPGKFRIVQDFSYPRLAPSTSLNSQINSTDFPCEWGFFHNMVDAIHDLPDGAMAVTCNVDAAFRQIPIHPDDRPHTVVAWEGNFYVDGFLPFGAASASGIFGRLGDAMAHIYTALGFGTVLKWVNDFLFIQAPPTSEHHDGPIPFSMDAIYEVTATLGWPWKLSKSVPFANCFVYLGFQWDIAQRRVSLPPAKREKYLARTREWLFRASVSLNESEKSVGSLMHCTLAIPDGCPRMAGLIAFQATFPRSHGKRFLRKVISETARCDVEWWIAKLSSDSCDSSIARPPPESRVHVSSDASTSFGLGVVIDNQWWSWRLLGGWKSNNRDIGWAEAVALELAIDGVIALGIRNASIVCHCDNQGVVYAAAIGRSRNVQQNVTFIRILDKAASAGLHITIRYIKSAENPADEPSRGVAPTSGVPSTVHIPIPSIYAPFLAPAMP